MDAGGLYLDLLKRSLTGGLSEHQRPADLHRIDAQALAEGRDWAEDALTMIGLARLDNIERCMNDVLDRGVPGDVIETGAWRGGATIFMRGVLKARDVRDRCVWVADSFRGFPSPSHAADRDDTLHTMDLFSVPVETVRANFARYGMLDEQVRFLEGYFRDTLTSLRGKPWAVIRLDGDLYESTMDALTSLYPGLSAGGWVIVDDYGAVDACAQAVRDFREREGIRDPMEQIDWTGVCWRRSDY